MNLSQSVSVVIPSYDMAWCIGRAVASCQNQSMPVREIIIVDDCSTDTTESVVRKLISSDSRICYLKHATNRGHLFALSSGIQRTATDWVALLDADDELTYTSLETRISAALRYRDATGITPQLLYGDLYYDQGNAARFIELQGDAYAFVSKELSLCQTSTIMLGRNSLTSFPVSSNPWCTDDTIVLAITKRHPVLHCGHAVAVCHIHDGATRMSNNPRNIFRGVYELVRDNRGEVLRTHGVRCLLSWHLRVLRAFCDYQIAVTNRRLLKPPSTWVGRCLRLFTQSYRLCCWCLRRLLARYLRSYFVLDYF